MLDLEPIKRREEEATPGEWSVNRYATDMSGAEHALAIEADGMRIANMGG